MLVAQFRPRHLLLRGVQVVLADTLIAGLVTAMNRNSFWANLIYAQCVGLSILLFIECGRRMLPVRPSGWPAGWRGLMLVAVGCTLGFVSNRSLDLPRRVSANADGSFTIGGSIAPLLLFMGVFLVRYVVNVALAIQPALSGNPGAAAAAAIAYGLTTGLLAARSRKIWGTRRDRDGLLAA